MEQRRSTRRSSSGLYRSDPDLTKSIVSQCYPLVLAMTGYIRTIQCYPVVLGSVSTPVGGNYYPTGARRGEGYDYYVPKRRSVDGE